VEHVRSLVTEKTKAIVAVDMCGQPCDMDALREIADEHKLVLIEDASHSIGATYKGRPVGSLADLTTLSFHPVKNITTGEGGAIVTSNEELFKRAQIFRQHGITRSAKERLEMGAHYYEMQELGFNYRLTDIQAALGIAQVKKLDTFIARRQAIAALYHEGFAGETLLTPIQEVEGTTNAHHIFVIRVHPDKVKATRDQVFAALRSEGIGANVHYIPVHMHPYYKEQGFKEGSCPKSEALYEEIITLPCFPLMSDQDAQDVITAVKKVCQAYASA